MSGPEEDFLDEDIEDMDVLFTPTEWARKARIEIPNQSGWWYRFSFDTGVLQNGWHAVHIFEPRSFEDPINAYEFMARLSGSAFPN